MTKYLSFPGLGIDPFLVDGTAFAIGSLDIKWYGIIITIGMIIAFLIARNRAKFEGIIEDDIYDVTLFCIVFGVIGARLYYVLFNLDDYIMTDGTVWQNIKNSFLEIINIRGGGLAIYGGIIAGVITGFVAARVKKIRFPVLLDVAAPAVLVGQILGRWGNFFNVEAFGSETSLPWRMGIHTTDGVAGEWMSEIFVHPTFLYESLWNLAALALVLVFYKKKKFNGQVFFFYMAWYGLGRFFIEGLRTDSLMLGDFRISQVVALVTFVAGIVMFFLFMFKTPKKLRLITALKPQSSLKEEQPDEEETQTEEITESESENDDGKTD